MSNDNLKLWDSVSKTDPAHTKETTLNKRKITTIDPQYQRMVATEQFGPFGIGWGVSGVAWSYMDFSNGTKLATYAAILWYKFDGERGEVPITSNIKVAYITNGGKGYLMVDDEYAKKGQTDAITKGLSSLGFNADVFMGKFDDNKYVNQLKEEFSSKFVVDDVARSWMNACTEDPKRLNEITDQKYRNFIAQQIGINP